MDGGDSLGILDVQEVGQSAVVHQAPLLQHGAHAAVLHQDVLAAQDMQQMVVLDDESCKGIMLDASCNVLSRFRNEETAAFPADCRRNPPALARSRLATRPYRAALSAATFARAMSG